MQKKLLSEISKNVASAWRLCLNRYELLPLDVTTFCRVLITLAHRKMRINHYYAKIYGTRGFSILFSRFIYFVGAPFTSSALVAVLTKT